MPVTVIVGGQYGSEGKGKASAHFANAKAASALIRVGGPNSGHTAVDANERVWTFRQLPAAVVASGAPVVLPSGSLIDVDILVDEIERFGLPRERLWIDPRASIVTPAHRSAETDLVARVGSTASGTGASLIERIKRSEDHRLAGSYPGLEKYICRDLGPRLRAMLNRSQRILIEGTQGFGLSLWHSDHYPFTTSRDTTAAGFVAEAGLAPHDVDHVVLVLRTFPIRVGGNSGPLANEIDWACLAEEADLPTGYHELTTATKRVRRVARFDPAVVKRAIEVNAPHAIVLNHMDYVDPRERKSGPSEKSRDFMRYVEREIGAQISLVGYGPDVLLTRDQVMQSKVA
jgi:adenylosuccinate synthase